MEKELRESEVRYRTLFESIDEGSFLCEVVFEGDEPVEDVRRLQPFRTYVPPSRAGVGPCV